MNQPPIPDFDYSTAEDGWYVLFYCWDAEEGVFCEPCRLESGEWKECGYSYREGSAGLGAIADYPFTGADKFADKESAVKCASTF